MSFLLGLAGTLLSLTILTASAVGGFVYGTTVWVVGAAIPDESQTSHTFDTPRERYDSYGVTGWPDMRYGEDSKPTAMIVNIYPNEHQECACRVAPSTETDKGFACRCIGKIPSYGDCREADWYAY